MTWDQIAEGLGINRSMIFHVLAGRRKFSPKILHKLEKSEKEAGIGAESSILTEQGERYKQLLAKFLFGEELDSAPATLKEIDRGTKTVTLEFRGTPPKNIGTEVTVTAASNATMLKIMGTSSPSEEPNKFLQACLPQQLAKDSILDKLTPQCYRLLWETALDLTFGVSWRK